MKICREDHSRWSLVTLKTEREGHCDWSGETEERERAERQSKSIMVGVSISFQGLCGNSWGGIFRLGSN